MSSSHNTGLVHVDVSIGSEHPQTTGGGPSLEGHVARNRPRHAKTEETGAPGDKGYGSYGQYQAYGTQKKYGSYKNYGSYTQYGTTKKYGEYKSYCRGKGGLPNYNTEYRKSRENPDAANCPVEAGGGMTGGPFIKECAWENSFHADRAEHWEVSTHYPGPESLDPVAWSTMKNDCQSSAAPHSIRTALPAQY